MRRFILTTVLVGAMLSAGGCCLFRGLDGAFARGLGESLRAHMLRPTVRLGTTDGLSGFPSGPFFGVHMEPGTDPDVEGYYTDPAWMTLAEFGSAYRGQPFGFGFKVQIPFPEAIRRRVGPITLLDGWLRLFAPAWGAGLARVMPSPEWEHAFTRTSGWTGADGVATIPLPGSRLLWLFGDTWIGPVIDGKHAAGSAMVNNTIAITPAAARVSQPEFFWGPADAKRVPTAWVVPEGTPSGAKAEWYWPCSGGIVTDDGRLVVFLCRLGRKDAGDSIWNFQARGTDLVVVSNPEDPPSKWKKSQHTIAPLTDMRSREVTWGQAVLPAGEGNLYICGIESTSVLKKQFLLARAPAGSIERFETWEFWDGAAWSGNPAAAEPLAAPLASELSVLRIRDRYVMLYSELTLGPTILCRTAERLEGPWSEPTIIYTCPEPAADKNLFVYAPKAHPELSYPGELLVSYCVNSMDFWDVAAHADKYRPRFVRVPLAMLAPPPR